MEKKDLILARLREQGYSQSTAAERLKISPQMVSNYINGGRNFGKAVAQKWSEAFGFNPNWLMYDELPVLLNDSSKTVINIGDIIDGDSNITRNSGTISTTKSNEAAMLKADISKLQSEITMLKADLTHKDEIIEQKNAQLAEKERLIGILLNNH